MTRLLHILKNPPQGPRTYLLIVAWLQIFSLAPQVGRPLQKILSGQFTFDGVFTLAVLLAATLYVLRQAHAHLMMITVVSTGLLYNLIAPLFVTRGLFSRYDLQGIAYVAFFLLLWCIPFFFDRKSKTEKTDIPEQVPHARQEA